MGIGLQKLGKLAEAIEAYKKALSNKNDNAEAFYNMGIVLQEQGKLEKALEAYNKALAIKPDYADAQNNICVILKGIIFNKPNKNFLQTITSILEKQVICSTH